MACQIIVRCLQLSFATYGEDGVALRNYSVWLFHVHVLANIENDFLYYVEDIQFKTITGPTGAWEVQQQFQSFKL